MTSFFLFILRRLNGATQPYVIYIFPQYFLTMLSVWGAPMKDVTNLLCQYLLGYGLGRNTFDLTK